jgi:hypothetical protein
MDYLKNLESVAALSARMADAALRGEHPRIRQLAETCCEQLDQAASLVREQSFQDLMREQKAELIRQTLSNDAMTRQTLDPQLHGLDLKVRREKFRNSHE